MEMVSTRYNNRYRVQEADFLEGQDWCVDIVRVRKSGELAFALYQGEGKELTVSHSVVGQDRTFVPPAQDEVLQHVRFPTLYHYRAPLVNDLLQMIDSLLKRCLDLDDEYRFLLACFVISTWVIDRLPVAPYVALVGPPGSGKTMTLKVLQLLCRRGLLTSDISSAAFYRACDRIMPTLLIDETATAGQQRTLFHLLRSGTTRDVVALRENRSYRTFGAKVVAWPELPHDEALNSRCIIFPMHETLRTDLLRPDSPEITQFANSVMARLFRYRLAKYRMLSVPSIRGVHGLRSRVRDLYESLALAIGEDPNACARLLECMEHQRDLNREPLPTNQSAVIGALHKKIHVHPEQTTYLNLDLTKEANLILAESGERIRLSPREVGTVLKTFGFYKKRTNQGWIVPLNRTALKLVHKLIFLYGVDVPLTCFPSPELEETCEFCKAQHAPYSEVSESNDSAANPPAPKATDIPVEEHRNREKEEEIEDKRYRPEEFEDAGDATLKEEIIRSIEIEDREGSDLD